MPDMNKKTILVVDDDHEIVRAITITLEREGYHVLNAYDGLQALDCVTSREVHLIIIDVMMPKLDGLSAVMKIREKKNLPIIILSAKGEDSDKILGLSMGADDYISKPFNPMELVARVKSQLRRYTDLGDINTRSDNVIVNGRLTFKLDEHVLYADGEPVKLTATETKIVELLMKHPGRIFPAEEIYSRIWNEPAYSAENTVMVHIQKLRKKLHLETEIQTVYKYGYRLAVQKGKP